MPWLETVRTKTGMGRNMALSMHPRRCVTAIYEGVKRAVTRLNDMRPFVFSSPLTYEIRFQRADAAQAASRAGRGFERLDAFTIVKRVGKVSELF